MYRSTQNGLWYAAPGDEAERREVESRNAALTRRRELEEAARGLDRAAWNGGMLVMLRHEALRDASVGAEGHRRMLDLDWNRMRLDWNRGRQAVALQNARNQGLVDVARVTPVALGGGAGVTPRFDSEGKPVGWDRTDPEPPDLSAQYEHELAMQGLRNEGAAAVAKENGAAQAALQAQKNEGAAQTATIKADAQRDAAAAAAEARTAAAEIAAAAKVANWSPSIEDVMLMGKMSKLERDAYIASRIGKAQPPAQEPSSSSSSSSSSSQGGRRRFDPNAN